MTEDEKIAIAARRYGEKASLRAIGAEIGMSHEAVRSLLLRNGVPIRTNGGGHGKKATPDKVAHLKAQGFTRKEIGRRLHISRSAVATRLSAARGRACSDSTA